MDLATSPILQTELVNKNVFCFLFTANKMKGSDLKINYWSSHFGWIFWKFLFIDPFKTLVDCSTKTIHARMREADFPYYFGHKLAMPL